MGTSDGAWGGTACHAKTLDCLGSGERDIAMLQSETNMKTQLLPTFYFVGLALLPRQLRKERKAAQTKARGSDALPLKPSPPATKKTVRGVKISAPIPINEDEEWKREPDAEDGGMDQDQITNGHDVMSEDSHAAHSMQPVQYARAL